MYSPCYRPATPGPLTTPILEALGLHGPPESDELWDSLERLSPLFDREGFPITLRQWVTLFEYKPYQLVERTTVNGFDVSTVWLGIDHGFSPFLTERKPWQIFETMVFEAELSYLEDHKRWHHKAYDDTMRRYATQELALAGHWALVEEISLIEMAFPDPRPESQRP